MVKQHSVEDWEAIVLLRMGRETIRSYLNDEENKDYQRAIKEEEV